LPTYERFQDRFEDLRLHVQLGIFTASPDLRLFLVFQATVLVYGVGILPLSGDSFSASQSDSLNPTLTSCSFHCCIGLAVCVNS